MSCDVNGTTTFMCPPEGAVVDFDNPTQIGVSNIWGVVVGMNIIALLLLAQRLHTKIYILGNFQVEDACVIAAWVASVTTQAIELHLYVVKATGVHLWEMSADRFSYFSRVILGAILIYQVCIGFSKATLCLFYRRLSQQPLFQAAVWFVFFVCTGSAIAIFLASLFSCNPIAAAWDPALAVTAHCINRPAVYIATAGIGIFTDVALFILPLPTIWSLQMPWRQKLGLVGIFAVGSTTMITSVIRMILLMPSLSTNDQTWALTSGTLWICIEANLLIMCCCLPTLRAFLRHVAPQLLGDKSSGKNTGSNPRYALRTFGGGDRRSTTKSAFDKKMKSQGTRLGTNYDDAASNEQDLKGPNSAVSQSHTAEVRAGSQSWLGDVDQNAEERPGFGSKTVTVKLSYEDA